MFTDDELFARGVRTVLASFEEYSRTLDGAALVRAPGVACAVFPREPERSVYNNALLERRLPSAGRNDALAAMEAVYADAGVERFAAWVHESDHAMRVDIEQRGYEFDTSTRAMGMCLDDIRLPRPQVELGSPAWADYLRTFDLPDGLLTAADRSAYRVLVAREDGEDVATAMAFDFEGDCGIYNVGTVAHARRRGLATALSTLQLYDALERGCVTASIQATEMAERVYAAVGFRDLGRFLEYVPGRHTAL